MLDAVLAVFMAVGEWFATAITALLPIFWTANAEGGGGELTILGVLALAGLAFSVIFLIVGIISNFFKFRA